MGGNEENGNPGKCLLTQPLQLLAPPPRSPAWLAAGEKSRVSEVGAPEWMWGQWSAKSGSNLHLRQSYPYVSTARHVFVETGLGVLFISYCRRSSVAHRSSTQRRQGWGGEVLAAVRGGTCCLGHCLQATFHFLLLPS